MKKLLHPILKAGRLGGFWRSIYKQHRHGKLAEGQVKWLIRARDKGARNGDIAMALGISERWVKSLYSRYREEGAIPSPGRPGRPRIHVPLEERIAIKHAWTRFKVGACYLVPVLKRYYGIDTNHMRVYRVMKEEGLLYHKARKKVRRRWVRWEREHSNTLWHVDWHQMKDSRWKGMWLIVYEDDASRRIMAHGVFAHTTSALSVEVLKQAMAEHGRLESILNDRGSTFYAVEAEARRKGLTEFETFLMGNHIEQILSGVRHPETNGKLEKLFDILETGLSRGISSIEECAYWYNCERPHGALDLERAETPIEAYYRKLPQRDVLVDPSQMTLGVK
jgi:putative transposase